ncbi:MAG: DUF2721 domain-containing protein [Phycisphaerae bacterium]|nr:DUF2721 domain-containing protein [Phycisphaerae bacterium]MCZ2400153.1 DUF2721 domain-containing protein [Phycisphaerae bacterium]NUQ46710.1 DUF2721 domain-containing protein [Phycisphaerae bacterium]
MSLADLIPTLQLAIGPAILISGVGLILLSMTNRFGRVIDRSRQLTNQMRGTSGAERERALAEVKVLWRRARIVRAGIALAVLSALLAALLIISLFVGSLLALGAAVPAGLFIMCMLSLIGALLVFFWDINLSLTALTLELPAESVTARSAKSSSTAATDHAS